MRCWIAEPEPRCPLVIVERLPELVERALDSNVALARATYFALVNPWLGLVLQRGSASVRRLIAVPDASVALPSHLAFFEQVELGYYDSSSVVVLDAVRPAHFEPYAVYW